MSDETLMWEEVADIGTLLHELEDASFDAPSLCSGWTVRDVLGHLSFGHTKSFAAVFASTARHRLNRIRASFDESKAMFADASSQQIRRFWDDVMVAAHPRKGVAMITPKRMSFLDHLVHHQDMRRPTGQGRVVPDERLARALELVRSVATPLFNPKRNVAGLNLRANDIGRSGGSGPTVEGPGEAIVMAASGRHSHSRS